MNFIELYRKKIMEDIDKTNSFIVPWKKSWKDHVTSIINNNLDSDSLKELGDSLREIFFLTSVAGRDQSSLSGGGTAWECLVTWYLNLGLVGTRTVVIKQKKSLIPSLIREALAVSYDGFDSNSESDLIAITFPESDNFRFSMKYLETLNLESINIDNLLNYNDNFDMKAIDQIVKDNFSELEVNVIQCKTNWNDNAQIPMAWDMIYSSYGFAGKDIHIGSKQYSIFKLKDFKYSFVTVPTQKDINDFKVTSTAVLRVKGLSGKNFWGVPTKENVANSIFEMFNIIYQGSFSENSYEERLLNNDYSYFLKE